MAFQGLSKEKPRPVVRRAGGPKLKVMIGGLALFEEGEPRLQPQRSLPSQVITPRLVLVPRKELKSNRDQVHQIRFIGRGFFDRLTEAVPSLAEPRDVTVDRLYHGTSTGGRHFMNLGFDDEESAALLEEQDEVRSALEAMAGEDMDWEDYRPTIDLLQVGTTPTPMSRPEVAYIADYIREKLPMPVLLDPVFRGENASPDAA